MRGHKKLQNAIMYPHIALPKFLVCFYTQKSIYRYLPVYVYIHTTTFAGIKSKNSVCQIYKEYTDYTQQEFCGRSCCTCWDKSHRSHRTWLLNKFTLFLAVLSWENGSKKMQTKCLVGQIYSRSVPFPPIAITSALTFRIIQPNDNGRSM